MLKSILPKIKLSKTRVRSAQIGKPLRTRRVFLMSAVFYLAALLAIGIVVVNVIFLS